MLPRERIEAALRFESPDKMPLRIYPAPSGLHEHGEALVDLTKRCGHDFGDLSGVSEPEAPDPGDYDANGRYHVIRTDEWGTTWEHNIYGVWGHPIGWPLTDRGQIERFTPPPVGRLVDEGLENAKRGVATAKETYYTLGHGGLVFERLHSVWRFEDVLMEMAAGNADVDVVADRIVENCMEHVENALAMDVDAIAFGDDFGTQQALLLSPEMWRSFFKPRYARMFEPIKKAGKRIFFHCCGRIDPLLPDFAELGVDALWPQLTAFDNAQLARTCRDLGLCLELHPDRGDLMQRATPTQVRDYLARLLETFDTPSGGSWLYVEIDPGFPWANVEALFEFAIEMRA